MASSFLLGLPQGLNTLQQLIAAKQQADLQNKNQLAQLIYSQQLQQARDAQEMGRSMALDKFRYQMEEPGREQENLFALAKAGNPEAMRKLGIPEPPPSQAGLKFESGPFGGQVMMRYDENGNLVAAQNIMPPKGRGGGGGGGDGTWTDGDAPGINTQIPPGYVVNPTNGKLIKDLSPQGVGEKEALAAWEKRRQAVITRVTKENQKRTEEIIPFDGAEYLRKELKAEWDKMPVKYKAFFPKEKRSKPAPPVKGGGKETSITAEEIAAAKEFPDKATFMSQNKGKSKKLLNEIWRATGRK